MKSYNHITTIEIDEQYHAVSIDFEHNGEDVTITKMTDLDTEDAIAPDLLGEFAADMLYAELDEFARDMEAGFNWRNN